MRQAHFSTTTLSLQDGQQDSSIKSMQEVEAPTLEIGIAQGIDDSSKLKGIICFSLIALNLRF
jgi:hypothetical protein